MNNLTTVDNALEQNLADLLYCGLLQQNNLNAYSNSGGSYESLPLIPISLSLTILRRRRKKRATFIVGRRCRLISALGYNAMMPLPSSSSSDPVFSTK